MECLKQPVFVVGDIDEDINLSVPPSSGEEYIKRVVIEARQCADVVVADLDPSYMKEPTRAYVETLAGCIQAPVNLKPTIEWQQYQVSDFSKIRLYVNQLKDEIQMGRHKWKPPEIELPDIDDQNAWINFCLGEKKIEPTLNTLFCFNQSSVEQVLEYLVQFVETERRIQYKIGRWIYTLLASLEQPLQPDTCHCLRSLARTCSIIRADSVIVIVCQTIKYHNTLELNQSISISERKERIFNDYLFNLIINEFTSILFCSMYKTHFQQISKSLNILYLYVKKDSS